MRDNLLGERNFEKNLARLATNFDRSPGNIPTFKHRGTHQSPGVLQRLVPCRVEVRKLRAFMVFNDCSAGNYEEFAFLNATAGIRTSQP